MKTINLTFEITGTKIFIPFQAICSLSDKEFSGEILIEYCPKMKTLEYIDAESEIAKITKEAKLTVEELANLIFQDITKSIEPKFLKVLVDVKASKAHQPVQVWIERDF